MPANPLLARWTGPRGGVPPFDRIDTAQFKPALLDAMEHQRAEIAAITHNIAAPTFANTIEALEASGRTLGRVGAIFGVYTTTMSDRAMQEIEAEMAPVLAAFSDEITQNAALFARIRAVYETRDTVQLAPDQARLTEVVYRNFARRGAALGAAHKARLAEINQRLATLFTAFGQNVLADEAQPGIVANTRSAAEPFLTYSPDRAQREQVWRMWISRGDHAGPHDNKPLITEILALRAERAKLLGYPSHAHWIADDNMAKTPEAALALMLDVWRAAVARVREEVADMQALADHPIEPWDYRYYAEHVRKAKYDLDANEVKAYLQLDNIRDAMFWVAQRLYGLEFRLLDGVPVYHPDVTVYEVVRAGELVGLWYFDPYARDGKRSGAWMSEYRTQESFREVVTPIVSNNANFVKAEPGAPVLISWDDARTMFHEFGHALHGLLSRVRYPTLAGTNTLRDFVELPSQLHEHWLATPEVLERFARHHETGEPMPAALVAKLQQAKHFNQGFATVEYLASAIYDMKIHMAGGDAIDPAAFETETMREIGCPPQIVMRHRPPHFAHIFSDDGYSAGYYSYLWADTLTADAAEAFQEAGSYYDATVAAKLHDAIMSTGNSVPPELAFRTFRGRDVDTNALMRDRGFPVG